MMNSCYKTMFFVMRYCFNSMFRGVLELNPFSTPLHKHKMKQLLAIFLFTTASHMDTDFLHLHL